MPTGAHEPRDVYVDWLRASSLVVVVLWHWAFTILRWTPQGPVPTNPLGFLSGVWILTWLLQVLPIFFYVGGTVHLISWEHGRLAGEPAIRFVLRHIRPMLVPAVSLVACWIALGVILTAFFDLVWVARVVLLIISPLWFLGVYVCLIALVPLTAWLHRKFDALALVWLGGLAMLVDVVRLKYGVSWIGWLNILLVWALAHQAGYFYRRLVDAPRSADVSLLSAGLLGLTGLMLSGQYPGSMVGVPGAGMSNIAPPTFVIVALVSFQIGLAEVVRPGMASWLRRPRIAKLNAAFNHLALPLFLFHTTGMAIAKAVEYALVTGGIVDDRAPDLAWWLRRPLAVLGPLLFTVPIIALFLWRARRLQGAQCR